MSWSLRTAPDVLPSIAVLPPEHQELIYDKLDELCDHPDAFAATDREVFYLINVPILEEVELPIYVLIIGADATKEQIVCKGIRTASIGQP
ncbi:MAG: hypothetical protein AAF663_11505 [Planctomycetota bacterium]